MKNTIWNNILNFFFPRLCALCRCNLLDNEEGICISCLSDLPLSYYKDTRHNPVVELFQNLQLKETKAISFLRFHKGGAGQEIIHQIKYMGKKHLGYYMGQTAALALKNNDIFDEVDMLIPVPLHPKRLRERGFNQSEWIAQGIADIVHIPVETRAISRIKNNERQALQPLFKRSANVSHIFQVEQAELLRGKKILIIDDVITSGLTLNSLATTIKEKVPDIKIHFFGLSSVV